MGRSFDFYPEPDAETEGDYVIMSISAYCPCVKCSDHWGTKTASGKTATQGRSVAADKSVPFGTKVYIEGLGVRVVEDRGGAIKGDKLDIFVDTHEQTRFWGRRNLKVWFID
jgi:3D (Asp-Asp-Asp) domain-containing protein